MKWGTRLHYRRSSVTCVAAGLLLIGALAENAIAQNLADEAELFEELRYLRAEAEAKVYAVSATRTRERLDKIGSTVAVISRRQILDMGARNLMDVLSTVGGLGVTQNALGIYEVEVRGVKTPFSEKVLFMIDSHPVNQSLINGGALWGSDTFLVENVKQVEIVRGPGSALYGANAFLAVINVITFDHTEDKVVVSAGGGSFDTHKYNLFVGKDIDELGVALNVNYFDSRGQNEFVARDVVGASGNIADAKTKWDADLKLFYGDVALHANFARQEKGPFVGIANALNDDSEQQYTNAFAELRYDRRLTERLRINAKAYYDFFRLDNYWELFPEGFGSGAFPDGVLTRSAVDNSKAGVDIATHVAVSDNNKLIIGASFEHQRQWGVEFEANFDPLTFVPLGGYRKLDKALDWTEEVTRDVYAVYAEDIWDVTEHLRWTLGARFDHYSDFGSTINPRSTLVWEFVENYRLRLSYGSAFRAPTFAELYNKNNPAIVGSRALQPEQIDTFEIGVGGDITETVGFNITGFRNEIRDIITPTAGTGAANIHANRGKIETMGVETELNWHFMPGGLFAANYTYQDSRYAHSDRRVADTPRHRATLLATVPLPYDLKWHTQLLLRQGTGRATGDNRPDAPGYGIVNTTLRAVDLLNYQGVELRGSIFNLFDKRYVDPSPIASTISDFPKPGRTFFIELSAGF
ncbi:MAG: colicin FY TonB-dependent receptor YuiR [Methylomicrobium sp.]